MVMVNINVIHIMVSMVMMIVMKIVVRIMVKMVVRMIGFGYGVRQTDAWSD